jgi:hypothetical protein
MVASSGGILSGEILHRMHSCLIVLFTESFFLVKGQSSDPACIAKDQRSTFTACFKTPPRTDTCSLKVVYGRHI